MLVKLISSTSGEVIMFSEHARLLFEAIGKECTARGVFSKEQLPEAISALRRAVADEKQMTERGDGKIQIEDEPDKDVDRQETEEAVSFKQRAIPLIRLMEFTKNEGGFILWESSADF